jgi:hypothetical protein
LELRKALTFAVQSNKHVSVESAPNTEPPLDRNKRGSNLPVVDSTSNADALTCARETF